MAEAGMPDRSTLCAARERVGCKPPPVHQYQRALAAQAAQRRGGEAGCANVVLAEGRVRATERLVRANALEQFLRRLHAAVDQFLARDHLHRQAALAINALDVRARNLDLVQLQDLGDLLLPIPRHRHTEQATGGDDLACSLPRFVCGHLFFRGCLRVEPCLHLLEQMHVRVRLPQVLRPLLELHAADDPR